MSAAPHRPATRSEPAEELAEELAQALPLMLAVEKRLEKEGGLARLSRRAKEVRYPAWDR
ncbi:MAG: hypothetical protein JWO82_3287 [Akkermansiaceae bacterium]|nr:hypothetical protein [Akkermansiaceae bacterium]